MREVLIMTAFESPLVSIIVPVYNVALYLDECLNSIKMQTYQNLEIIVVEDCSTDHSIQVLQPYLKDRRIKFIKNVKNLGLSATRNKGIDLATGVYIMFVDSDDIIDLSLVKTCVDCATTTKADLITYGHAQFSDTPETVKQPCSPSDLELISYKQGNEYFNLDHYCWANFIRFSVLKHSNIRFPIGFYYEDGPFHWHLGLEIKNRYYLPKKMYLYRKHSKSISALSSENGRKLLDAFTLELEIIALVKRYRRDELKNVLSRRLIDFNFYNLLYIDDAFLASALIKVKVVESSMRENDYEQVFNYRSITVLFLTLVPNYISLPFLRLIRIMLHKIFKPTRKLIRNAFKYFSSNNESDVTYQDV